MKILSDFDGVMTEQSEEGALELQIFRDGIVAAGLSPNETDELVAQGVRDLAAAPLRHGWRSKGRLTGYADEDLFIRNIALATHFDQRSDATTSGPDTSFDALARRARAALVTAGTASFWDLVVRAHDEMVRRTQAGQLTPMDPIVGRTLEALLADGHEIVVVSNSGNQRVLSLLESLGLRPSAHDQAPHESFRVRGGARKFELGPDPQWLDFGGREVDVARPPYQTILREEQPDFVIGDVFSFDLATPLQLARTQEIRPLRAILRLRAYTPAWARSLCGADDVLAMSHFDELPSLIQSA